MTKQCFMFGTKYICYEERVDEDKENCENQLYEYRNRL